jgi:hypothetical protein
MNVDVHFHIHKNQPLDLVLSKLYLVLTSLDAYVMWHVDTLLGNDSIKHMPAATIGLLPLLCIIAVNTTLEEAVFPMDPPRDYIITTEQTWKILLTRVEVGSNTSTVTLRVVEGDEKGSLKYETVKYGHESSGLWPENNCAGED